MASLLQRICWNSRGWRGPTREQFRREDSYVGNTGFGHEEWNFNTSDVIDGFIYGYTYYPQKQHTTIGFGPHDIHFFAIAPKKERRLVGRYSNAYFLRGDEIAALKKVFRSSDVFERRVEELVALNIETLSDRDAAEKKLYSDFAFNVRVRPEDVTSYNPPRVLTADDIDGKDPIRLNRYTKPVFLTHDPVGQAATPSEDVDLIEDAYVRFTRKQRKVIERRHNQLSNRFRAWLKHMGASQITSETKAIDVWCVFEAESYLVELKTVFNQSTRHAIREALGQLLEYSCFPGRTCPVHLAIVLDAMPSTEEFEWIKTICDVGVAIEVFWLQGESVFSRNATTPLGSKAQSLSDTE